MADRSRCCVIVFPLAVDNRSARNVFASQTCANSSRVVCGGLQISLFVGSKSSLLPSLLPWQISCFMIGVWGEIGGGRMRIEEIRVGEGETIERFL